jgi:hypothetical protein
MLHQLPRSTQDHGAPSRRPRTIYGNGHARTRATRPSSSPSHSPARLGTAFTRCLLVRTDSPGLMLVALRVLQARRLWLAPQAGT